MNTKFGIDIVEVKRVEKLVKRRKNFLTRMFTPKEIAYCSVKKNCFPHYASRFAAKEAFLKAVSSGWQGVLKWTDIEIFNDKFGKPEITLLLPKNNKLRRKIKNIELTISQDKNYAVAMVALDGKKMKLATGTEMREVDAKSIGKNGLTGLKLMENAGISAVKILSEKSKSLKGKNITIIAGCGNNGGDGFVVARLLLLKKIKPVVILAGDGKSIKGDAAANLQRIINKGVTPVELKGASLDGKIKEIISKSDIIIDALFGTGLKEGIKNKLLVELIESVNAAGAAVFALDVPSGVDADTGAVKGSAIKANITVSFGMMKIGLISYPGAEYSGEVVVTDIGFPKSVTERYGKQSELLELSQMKSLLPERKPDANKGSAGKVFVVGGSPGLPGAPYLAGWAALRSGAGLTCLGVGESVYNIIAGKVSELIYKIVDENQKGALGVSSIDDIVKTGNTYDVTAAGPGIGKDKETGVLIERLIRDSKMPLVLDADALNHIALNLRMLQNKKAILVLTPHPGEMSRLTGLSIKDIQENRAETARSFAVKHGVILVLKGAGTVIADPEGNISINPTGNSGMATAGTGDVLCGMIASFIAQGVKPASAAKLGCFIHGVAGDIAAKDKGTAGLLASDLIENIPYAEKKIRSAK